MTHDEMIDVITHHKNGGEVEYYTGDDIGWILTDDPVWNFGENDYRPKPEPMVIYAEVSYITGQILRTSTKPIFHENDNTIIKKFIEAP
jgi:hypothetical protein